MLRSGWREELSPAAILGVFRVIGFGKAGPTAWIRGNSRRSRYRKGIGLDWLCDVHSTAHLSRTWSSDAHKSPKNHFMRSTEQSNELPCSRPRLHQLCRPNRLFSKHFPKIPKNHNNHAPRHFSQQIRNSQQTHFFPPKHLAALFLPAQNVAKKPLPRCTTQAMASLPNVVDFCNTKTPPNRTACCF